MHRALSKDRYGRIDANAYASFSTLRMMAL